ncbi:MAG TPA: hypothetical protein VEB64_08095, partial [Azospirillaceae bacterium]|nr:hypothetical protein [Azospirillaceae bacterium]
KERLHAMIHEGIANSRKKGGLVKSGRFLEAGGKRKAAAAEAEVPTRRRSKADAPIPPPPPPSPAEEIGRNWFDDEDDRIAVTFDMSRVTKAERANP